MKNCRYCNKPLTSVEVSMMYDYADGDNFWDGWTQGSIQSVKCGHCFKDISLDFDLTGDQEDIDELDFEIDEDDSDEAERLDAGGEEE